jgi:signal transduction histidine kinase
MQKDGNVDQQHPELEAARVAIVSLLAVMTDEQLRSVETALEALEPMYDAARAALDEMRITGHHRRPTGGQDQDMRQAIEAHLARLDKAR